MLAHLARASIEGAVLAAVVWLACRGLPRLPASVRALLWWSVAAKFIVALASPSAIVLPVLPRAAAHAPAREAAATPAPPLPKAQAGAAARPAPLPARGSGAPEIPWTAVVVCAWALGLGLSLLRTLRGWRRTRAVVARSRPGGPALQAVLGELAGRLALRRTVEVRVSTEVETPLVVDGRRPVILVPGERFAALHPAEQRMALCHELAHLKRGDVWLGCVPAAAERCFFFHPLARLAAREYAFWREAACDEAVLATLGASPQSYGRMLLALGVSRQTATFSAAGAAWSFGNLKRRLTMLDRTSPLSLRGRLLAAGAVALALLAIAPIRAVARSATAAPPAVAQTARATPAPAVVARTAPRGGGDASATPAARPSAGPGAEHAAPAAAEAAEPRVQELHFVLFREDGNATMSGRSADAERARRHRRGGEPMLWFRYGGQEYVVRDRGVLAQVEEAWEPVGRVGEEQGRIGAQQGAIGEEQARIGARQAEVGAQQATIGAQQGVIGARLGVLASREAAGVSASERREIERERTELGAEMRRLGEEMAVLGRRMRDVSAPMSDRGDEMAALGREMGVLGDRMRAAVARANAETVALVRRAIESGAAAAVR
ncbi:M56 family metallopeptidase [Longimicrobium sp.]|jgi:beta-lactamase regulating signal transducer with metallopeptidase domain|uniref:M56 family metallopeptidase n=1 Tax=Longimicrobium sp. TaxID=2029185 RepID=UPI002ED88F21